MADSKVMDGTAEFWGFSNRVYRMPGVARDCLALQDDHGLDVNMVLFCIWAGLTRGVLGNADLAQASALSATWAGQVVGPLRSIRKWMKPAENRLSGMERDSVSGLRESIKRNELDAEHLQQLALEALISGNHAGPGAKQGEREALSNVNQYLLNCGVREAAGATILLERIVAAALRIED
jgi:uncharacterized protein (TIGR02444 family)